MQNSKRFKLGISFLFTALAFTNYAVSQSPNRVTPSLISAPINEGSRVVLRGNVHPLAQARYDVGLAPTSAPANRLRIILKRSAQQDAELTAYLKDVQNPGSAQFRKFLLPEEFGARFGISDADVAKVQQWLHARGFTVAGINKGRTAIEFSGTVEQVEAAFQTSIHRFNINGTEHWANVADPQIPSAIAAVVGGITSLNDFKPESNIVRGPAGKWDRATHRFIPELTVTHNAVQALLLGPGDAATIYNTPTLLNTGLATGQATYDGSGVTIGVAGTTLLEGIGASNYRSFFGLDTAGNLRTVYDGNTENFNQSADELEAIADVEIAGALAPGANILYYAAGNTAFQAGLLLAINRAIDDNQIDILNVSYGACEAALGTAGNLEILNLWQQAAAQGITVTVSSGDSGSAGCDNQNTEVAASHGFGVNGLASTPYNIAVGGTDFDVLSKNFSDYVGANSSNYTSALKYIPENPWNDSTSSNGLLASNQPLQSSTGTTNIWAGGGGASSAASGTSGYPKPDWQKSFSASNTDSVRDLPDVSLFAGAEHYKAIWALCQQGDCSNGSQSSIHGVGGTSTSSPAFAGILALVIQKLGASTRLGQANGVLYKLAQSTPSVFHAITTGNNSVYCSTGTANCGSNNFLTGYNAKANYNMATGLGSVDATQLVNHWDDDSLATTAATLSLDKTTFVHGTLVNITANVKPSAATGKIAITDDYAAQANATSNPGGTMLALSGGSAAGSFSQFPGGTYNVYARYGGDESHAGSLSQPVQVTVSPEESVLNFTAGTLNSSDQLVNLAGKSVPLGSLISMNAQPVGASQTGSKNAVTNATGTVTFIDAYTTNGSQWSIAAPVDSSGNAEDNRISFQAGPHSITATYGGDLSYNASSSSAINFTIAPAVTSISVSSLDSSTIQDPVQVQAQITAPLASSAAFSPSGTVTFTDTTSKTVLGNTTYTNVGSCTGVSTYCFVATLQVTSTQLLAGANSIVASYSGDTNFSASGDSAPITVTCNASCWNQAGQRLALSFYQSTPSGPLTAGQSSTTPVLVGQSGGFTGDVNLTCTVTGKNANDQQIPTCSFNPAKVTVTGNDATTTLTLTTTAAKQSSAAKRSNSQMPWEAGTIALGSLLLCIAPVRRYRSLLLASFAALLLSVGCMTGCGGGGSASGGGSGGGGGTTTIPGTTADTYTVTFRAVDVATGTVTAQDYFNFNVN